jgi:hypothetical protein
MEYACLENIGNINREIVAPFLINNSTIGKQYYTDMGLTLETLKKGTEFSITDIIAVTKH